VLIFLSDTPKPRHFGTFLISPTQSIWPFCDNENYFFTVVYEGENIHISIKSVRGRYLVMQTIDFDGHISCTADVTISLYCF
jgi:hypothetical protein